LPPTQVSPHLHHVETATGAGEWRTLPWDTEQLGVSAARLDLLGSSGLYAEARVERQKLIDLVLDECRKTGIQHLSARVDSGDIATIHSLEGAGFELIDGIQTFLLPLHEEQGVAPPDTRLFEQADLPEVLAIGKSAFVFDRFHADPTLSKETADKLNESWTRNCCLGIAADAVLIGTEGIYIASYVTCRVDRQSRKGSIILVATAPQARGRGFAKRTSLAAIQWLASQGMVSVEVGTQFRNVPAARLYESLGFRQIRTSFTFRKVL
jgi:ribosomal protein S18 acetylase RimI-like enzyme